jgi:prepilin-type processing-associated H-X9-DG protein
VRVAPASSPHAVKPQSRKGTEPGPHRTSRDSSDARAASAGVRTCLHSRGSSDQPARDWVASDLSQLPHGANFAFMDGSVHFIKDSVSTWQLGPPQNGFRAPLGYSVDTYGTFTPTSPQARVGVYQALSTRNGGEVISSDSY